MPKTLTQNLQEVARQAAVGSAPQDGVGNFIDSVSDGEGVTTFHFESKLKGYRDWRWNVVLFQDATTHEATISEVVLMPGDESLIAPDWVPWSERLADYKALQAELEAQAALEAAEAVDLEDDEEADDDEDADFEDGILETDVEEDEIAEPDSESDTGEDSEGLTVSDSNEANNAEDDADSTGIWPKRLFGRRKGRVKSKDRNKGKNPKN
jgi:hypothetical protein